MANKKINRAILMMTAATMLISSAVWAAPSDVPPTPPTPPAPKASDPAEKIPASLDADEVVYDMRSGVMTATGNVLMTRGTVKVTGKTAQYNTKTNAGNVLGDVIAVDRGMRLTADTCVTDGNHMVAQGNIVRATKADKTYTGPKVDYFQKEDYILMESGGTINSTAGDVFSANRMEGWNKMNYAKGTGNAHLVSAVNKLDATGDVVDYYGKKQGSAEPAKAYLTGNAVAVQDNNTLRSNRLVIYLEDEKAKAAEAE